MSADAHEGGPAPRANLEIAGVTRHFGAVRANTDISLTVRAGEVAGLLGPNGAGKTTLIRICAGWLRAQAGTVHIMGLRQSPAHRRTRRLLGVVSHDAPPHAVLTVRENLAHQACLFGLGPAATRAALDRVTADYALGDLLRRRVDTLSTGMLQRVKIAAAMLHRPRVILLDEPTVGLDPAMRRHIWECLATVLREPVAILLTTHYFDEAVALCSQVHVLHQGRIALSLDRAALAAASPADLERRYLNVFLAPPPGGAAP